MSIKMITKESSTCSICLEIISGAQAKLSCSHEFHLKCWMKLQMSGGINKRCCPNCRKVQDIPYINSVPQVPRAPRAPWVEPRVHFGDVVMSDDINVINRMINTSIVRHGNGSGSVLRLEAMRASAERRASDERASEARRYNLEANPHRRHRRDNFNLNGGRSMVRNSAPAPVFVDDLIMSSTRVNHVYTVDRLTIRIRGGLIPSSVIREEMNKLVIRGIFRKSRNNFDRRRYDYCRVR